MGEKEVLKDCNLCWTRIETWQRKYHKKLTSKPEKLLLLNSGWWSYGH